MKTALRFKIALDYTLTQPPTPNPLTQTHASILLTTLVQLKKCSCNGQGEVITRSNTSISVFVPLLPLNWKKKCIYNYIFKHNLLNDNDNDSGHSSALPTTKSSCHINTILFKFDYVLYNGQFLPSPRWPLRRGLTVKLLREVHHMNNFLLLIVGSLDWRVHVNIATYLRCQLYLKLKQERWHLKVVKTQGCIWISS